MAISELAVGKSDGPRPARRSIVYDNHRLQYPGHGDCQQLTVALDSLAAKRKAARHDTCPSGRYISQQSKKVGSEQSILEDQEHKKLRQERKSSEKSEDERNKKISWLKRKQN